MYKFKILIPMNEVTLYPTIPVRIVNPNIKLQQLVVLPFDGLSTV